jgi:hypothetical protein
MDSEIAPYLKPQLQITMSYKNILKTQVGTGFGKITQTAGARHLVEFLL